MFMIDLAIVVAYIYCIGKYAECSCASLINYMLGYINIILVGVQLYIMYKSHRVAAYAAYEPSKAVCNQFY